MNDYRPRLSVEITQYQASQLQKILPHGMQKPLFNVLLNGLFELYTTGGYEAVGAIISGYISVQQVAEKGDINTLRQRLKELTDA